ESRENQSAGSGGRSRGGGGGVQYTARGGAIRFGRGCRKLACAGTRVGGGGIGYLVGGAPFAAGERFSIQGFGIPTGEPVGALRVCSARRSRRIGFRGVHQTAAEDARAILTIPTSDEVVAARCGRAFGRRDGLVCAADAGRWLQIRRRRAQQWH